MMRDCVAGLTNETAGGHPVASGGRVPIDKYTEFKQRVIDWHKD